MLAVNTKYILRTGPQTKPFDRSVLEDAYSADASKKPAEGIEAKLNSLGYGPDGDRQLTEAILEFSRLLLEKSGNRSLYSSSERLGDLLNTTSLSLLQSSLRLSLCLAQRYYSRQRGSHQQTMLAQHFNIDLEKLQRIAAPFPRSSAVSPAPAASTKGKEKTTQSTNPNANELVTLVREHEGWEEWGNVRMLYYPSALERQPRAPELGQTEQSANAPSTPTPLRRSATHPTPRLTSGSNAEESPTVNANASGKSDEVTRGGKNLDLPYSQLSSTSAEQLLASNLHL